MNNKNEQKTPIPHNGKKVNDWETLRPYVEEAAPPSDAYIEGLSNRGAAFGPEWDKGYNALGKDTVPERIEADDLQKM